MTLLAFASAKASPGVTTSLVTLAATWPRQRPVLVAELDPAGGDLAARFGLNADPGLVTLAAAARHAQAAMPYDTITSNSQELAESVSALIAPAGSDQTRAALATLKGKLGPSLSGLDGIDVLADCGRADPGSPIFELASHCASVILFCRPRADEVSHLRSRISALTHLADLGVVLVGERPYSQTQVAEALGVPVLGVMADDPDAAGLLNSGQARIAALRRTALVRSAASLAEILATPLTYPASDETGTVFWHLEKAND